MENFSDTHPELEILIATMQRNSLEFLKPMFPDGNFTKYHLLIINQTDGTALLESTHNSVRVINSYELGLAKSRNLAIENAIGKICLIADDDIQYVSGFDQIIKRTYDRLSNAAMILFKVDTLEGVPFKPYPLASKMFERTNELESISSIEMSFNRSAIVQNGIQFNELFGLNSKFPCGEEFIFCKDVFEAGGPVYFENRTVVLHSVVRSTTNPGIDHLVYARGALKYIKNKFLSPFMNLNMVLYLVRNNFITLSQIPQKLQVAFKGRRDYKKTLKKKSVS